MRSEKIFLHHFEPFSYSNGPGCRAVIWTQGCSLRCAGCYNQQTHPFRKDNPVSIDHLIEKIYHIQDKIEGITISGGEPFDQQESLLQLLIRIKELKNLSIIVFTGYRWQELTHFIHFPLSVSLIDVLITGRYEPSSNASNIGLIQPHKTYYFLTNRYNKANLTNVPSAEIWIDHAGEIILSGTNPIVW